MWIGVTQRFKTFLSNLQLTADQVSDGETKHAGVRKCLNKYYYETLSETENSFLIGSWAKLTRVRPPRDVDLYFVLPYAVYERFAAYSGNKQSALLQEVKNVLLNTYSTSDMSGDGQVVLVRFNTINVEIVPAFLLTSGRYYIPNTHDGGSYKETDPNAELSAIQAADKANNYNVRPIVRMMKAWQSNCSVSIKSFHLELLVTEFLSQSPWRLNSEFYYDWLSRDFFTFLLTKVDGVVYAPGTYEVMFLGNEWKSKCESAQTRAIKACDFEYLDKVPEAGEEWRKIFGDQIPVNV